PPRKALVVHATYDLTFLKRYSLEVLENFRRYGVDFDSRVLPCGHYTTGETPYKYMDGWFLGSFVHRAFKDFKARSASVNRASSGEHASSTPPERDLIAR
ncbi:MAG TPA: hypothetical protein VGM17_04295, partial [Rhizomicrobium sp.]